MKKEAERIQKLIGVRKSAVTRETRKAHKFIDSYKAAKIDDPEPSIVSYSISKDAFKLLGVAKEKLVDLQKWFDLHSDCISMACDDTGSVQKTYIAAKVKKNEDQLIAYSKKVWDLGISEKETISDMNKKINDRV